MPTWDENEAQLAVDAIRGTPLCVGCIIRQTGVTRARVETIFTRLGTTLKVTRATARCDGCLIERDVFGIV